MRRLLTISFLFFFYGLVGQEKRHNEHSTWLLNDVVRTVLENQKEIAIRYENIEVQAGLARQAAAPFDLIPTSQYNRIISKNFTSNRPPPTRVKLSSFDSQFYATLNKTFRLGTVFSVSAQVNNIRNVLKSSPRGIGFGFLTPFTIPNYQLTFQVQQPLLKNFVCGLNVMEEKAQRLQVAVAQHSAVYFVSDRITNAAILYWEVVAAEKLIEIHLEGIRQYLDLIDKIQKLIQGQQIAAGDIVQPQAQLGQERANLLNAYQTYNTAVQNLKYAMGVGDQCIAGEDEKLLTQPYPPLQEIQHFGDRSCALLMKAVKQLYPNRQDILAMEINEASANARLIGSRNQSLPQLDVYGTYEDMLYRQHTWPVKQCERAYNRVVTVGVVVSQPLGNDYALGLVRQRQAELNQASLMTKLLKEEMSANFVQLWQNHFVLGDAVKEASIAVELYAGLIQNEIKKLRAGFSTVFVIIDFERQLIQAQISLNEAYKNYAQNIVQYRFVTGTLLRMKDRWNTQFDVEPLTEWPQLL